MRTYNWIIILGLLCCSPKLAAQTDSIVRPYLFISPIKTIDPSNPGVLYGGGVVLPGGYAVELGHLVLFSRLPRVPNVTDNRGNRFHLSLRKYLDVFNDADIKPYLQLRGDLLSRTHRSVVSIESLADPNGDFSTVYEDTVTVRSRITTLNLMAGIEQQLGRHFAIDITAGLGVRWKYIRHEDRINPNDKYLFDNVRDDEWYSRSDPERSGGYFNIPLDIRLLYRF